MSKKINSFGLNILCGLGVTLVVSALAGIGAAHAGPLETELDRCLEAVLEQSPAAYSDLKPVSAEDDDDGTPRRRIYEPGGAIIIYLDFRTIEDGAEPRKAAGCDFGVHKTLWAKLAFDNFRARLAKEYGPFTSRDTKSDTLLIDEAGCLPDGRPLRIVMSAMPNSISDNGYLLGIRDSIPDAPGC